jgi:RNA polymerase sigma-70 factor (ECF subfamily)
MAIVDVFWRGLAGGPTAPPSDLAPLLDSICARARSARPSVQLAPEAFVEHLGELLAGRADWLPALRALRAEDVHLAVACASGDRGALAEFEATYRPEIHATLSRMGFSALEIDETMQVMRAELLVGRPGAPPRILSYAGTGELRAWLRAVASRTGLRVERRAPRTTELHESMLAASGDDLELDYMKRTYGAAFEQGLSEGLAALDPGERILLRQRFREGLSIEELAARHRVHESTASRRVKDARERLVRATRDAMMKHLGVGRAEVSSIIRLIQSQIEVTLSTRESLAAGDQAERSAKRPR